MSALLPLFPLGTVLFPGQTLALRVFEQRYQHLVRDLLAGPEALRRFGVVSIEHGHEVGAHAARRLAAVGCAAHVRVINERGPGRYNLLAVGESRFRVTATDATLPYLRATVTPLAEEAGPDAVERAREAAAVFAAYRRLVAARGASLPPLVGLPPLELSYALAACLALPRPARQRLLEAPHAAARLAAERDLLHHEIAVQRRLPSAPVVDPHVGRGAGLN